QYAAGAVQDLSIGSRIKGQDLLHRGVKGERSGIVSRAIECGSRSGNVNRYRYRWLSWNGVSIVERARLECLRRDDTGVQNGGAESLQLAIYEEEGPVFRNRPAEGEAKLIAHERIIVAVSGKVVLRRKRGITAKPVRVRMKIIGAVLCDNVNDGPAVAPKLRQVTVVDNAKLLRGLRIQRAYASWETAKIGVVVVRAVHQKIVAAFARAVHGEAAEEAVALDHPRRQ